MSIWERLDTYKRWRTVSEVIVFDLAHHQVEDNHMLQHAKRSVVNDLFWGLQQATREMIDFMCETRAVHCDVVQKQLDTAPTDTLMLALEHWAGYVAWTNARMPRPWYVTTDMNMSEAEGYVEALRSVLKSKHVVAFLSGLHSRLGMGSSLAVLGGHSDDVLKLIVSHVLCIE